MPAPPAASAVPSRPSPWATPAFSAGGALLAGLDAAGECHAVMLILGDMPGVDAAVIDSVRADWERHRPWAAVTEYERRPRSSVRVLVKAVWKILDAQPERVRRIPVDRQLPLDVDTWKDYDAVCAAFGFTAPVR